MDAPDTQSERNQDRVLRMLTEEIGHNRHVDGGHVDPEAEPTDLEPTKRQKSRYITHLGVYLCLRAPTKAEIFTRNNLRVIRYCGLGRR